MYVNGTCMQNSHCRWICHTPVGDGIVLSLGCSRLYCVVFYVCLRQIWVKLLLKCIHTHTHTNTHTHIYSDYNSVLKIEAQTWDKQRRRQD